MLLWCSCACTKCTTRHGNQNINMLLFQKEGYLMDMEVEMKAMLWLIYTMWATWVWLCTVACALYKIICSGISVTLYNAFFEKMYNFLSVYDLLYCMFVGFCSSSALVSGDNLMSKWPSLQGRLFALPNSAHPTEDTETANQSQKPLVIISICSMYHC